MPRDIPVGNGQMLVAFDRDYQIRDLYYPHVGQENHAGGGPCRFGVWAAVPQTPHTQQDRRKRRLFWSNQGWQVTLAYLPQTLATDVRLVHPTLQVALRCCDVVDFHRSLLVRRIEVTNDLDEPRLIALFHHNNFSMFGTRVGDTVYFDPTLRCLIHYRGTRYLMAGWYADGEPRMDEYATGFAGFMEAEGTWRDAEDGKLGNNSIAQGAVDSTMMLQLHLPARGVRAVHLVLGAGHSYQDMEELHRFLNRETPQGVVDRTKAYWRLWLGAARGDFPAVSEGGPSAQVVDLFHRSLLVMRTQIDNSGAIIAANDTDIMQFQRDTYSYLWPRDGALAAAALDDAGFPDVARSFFSLAARIISEPGYFLHKYNPDGSPASSWHPWVSLGKPQLPIQEDETALVLWALWRHYQLYRDIEFVRPLWVSLITRAADFLVRFRDPDTHLPMPSYNLWEDSWGVHAFTVATVFGGLQAAEQFAACFGDTHRAESYALAAQEVREAFGRYFWSDSLDRFLRRVVPLDHSRTARLMADVLAGRTPQPDQAWSAERPRREGGPGKRPRKAAPAPLEFEFDPLLDSSMYAIFAMGLLSVTDPRVDKTMRAIEQHLWVKTPVGGLARYQGDTYYRSAEPHDRAVPGNPWPVCTLWLADWQIARASNPTELARAMPIFEWVANHALPSGVLAEQVHSGTGDPLSVSPLTWSHAAVVSSLMGYLRKLEQMRVCPTCGQRRGGRAADPRHPGQGPHAAPAAE